jgi:hypothetical protein
MSEERKGWRSWKKFQLKFTKPNTWFYHSHQAKGIQIRWPQVFPRTSPVWTWLSSCKSFVSGWFWSFYGWPIFNMRFSIFWRYWLRRTVGVFLWVFDSTMSRKSLAVGTGAIALRPLVDMAGDVQKVWTLGLGVYRKFLVPRDAVHTWLV